MDTCDHFCEPSYRTSTCWLTMLMRKWKKWWERCPHPARWEVSGLVVWILDIMGNLARSGPRKPPYIFGPLCIKHISLIILLDRQLDSRHIFVKIMHFETCSNLKPSEHVKVEFCLEMKLLHFLWFYLHRSCRWMNSLRRYLFPAIATNQIFWPSSRQWLMNGLDSGALLKQRPNKQ